jgi:hypothetical protein
MLSFDVNVCSKAAAQNVFPDIPGAQVKKGVLQGKYIVEFFISHSPGFGRAVLSYVFLCVFLHISLRAEGLQVKIPEGCLSPLLWFGG